jgi:hypothetical protein
MPSRTIQIEVSVNLCDDEEEELYIYWSPVVGVLCVVETEYAQAYFGGHKIPRPGATHQEMIDMGWHSCHPWNWFPIVWPVLADGNADDEYPLRVDHERLEVAGVLYKAIVPATWPPEQDRENAIRIGRELFKNKGSRVNFAHVKAKAEPVQSEIPF